MESVLLELLNRSINAGWLVLAVVLLRRLFKKAPKNFFIVLWALVGIRLICPFSTESALSLIPDAEPIPTNIIYSVQPAPSGTADIESGYYMNSAEPTDESTVCTSEADADGGNKVNDSLQLMNVLPAAVRTIGMLGLLLYAAVSCFRLRRKIGESIPLRENIRLCDRIVSPFLFGILRPRIYLPSSLPAEDAEYAVAHERAHLKRHDNWWKPLGFLLLTVYWFNPLMWVAYILLCRDIELACDEKVISQLGAESKKAYSTALINCSVPRRIIASCPLAFGEVAVKERVKTVLHYKKPRLWLNAVTAVTCIAAALCFLTDPISTAEVFSPQPPTEQINAEDASKPEPMHIHSHGSCTAEEASYIHAVLGNRIQTWYSSFDVDENGNEYESYNYELPEEIAEKYGTRDSRMLPSIMIFESIGELDSTETFEVNYGTRNYDYYFESGDVEYTVKRTEVYEVVIPAGGVAFCVLDAGDYDISEGRSIMLSGKSISATYGDLTYINK